MHATATHIHCIFGSVYYKQLTIEFVYKIVRMWNIAETVLIGFTANYFDVGN